jgi:hypothetical protein
MNVDLRFRWGGGVCAKMLGGGWTDREAKHFGVARLCVFGLRGGLVGWGAAGGVWADAGR